MTSSDNIHALIEALPKVELHLHIEGTLEPELMWQLAQKHNIELPYDSIQAIKQAYQFEDLQSFLDLYYQGAEVLRDEDDFYQLTWSYLKKCGEQNIVHTEMMFDPQSHTERGIGYEVFMQGFARAMVKAKTELGVSSYLILSFLRHLNEQSALETLELASPYYDMITAIGLDSSELGNPPEKFERAFAKASELGFKLVAHAGEEGPPEYIWGAINTLNVDRIDHGVRCNEDSKLLDALEKSKMPLTVCPLSNLKLCVVDDLSQHNILELLERGLAVTVNSDDPSYFGGYLNENYMALANALSMNKQQLYKLVKNAFIASFLPETDKQKWLAVIDSLPTQ